MRSENDLISPIIDRILEENPHDYSEVKKLLERNENFSPLERNQIVFTIFIHAIFVPSPIRQREEIPYNKKRDFEELLAFCKSKKFEFYLAAVLLTKIESPDLLKTCISLLERVQINTANLEDTGVNLFHCGAASPHLYETFFSFAVNKGHDPNQQLSKSKHNINDWWGNAPLHTIIANEHIPNMVSFIHLCNQNKLLIKLTIKDKEGKNPLILAAKMNNIKAFQHLSETFISSPDFKEALLDNDHNGRNCAHYAIIHNSQKMLELIVIQLNQTDKEHILSKKDLKGRTPIEYFCLDGFRKRIRNLFSSVAINPDRLYPVPNPEHLRRTSVPSQESLINQACSVQNIIKTKRALCVSFPLTHGQILLLEKLTDRETIRAKREQTIYFIGFASLAVIAVYLLPKTTLFLGLVLLGASYLTNNTNRTASTNLRSHSQSDSIFSSHRNQPQGESVNFSPNMTY